LLKKSFPLPERVTLSQRLEGGENLYQ